MYCCFVKAARDAQQSVTCDTSRREASVQNPLPPPFPAASGEETSHSGPGASGGKRGMNLIPNYVAAPHNLLDLPQPGMHHPPLPLPEGKPRVKVVSTRWEGSNEG